MDNGPPGQLAFQTCSVHSINARAWHRKGRKQSQRHSVEKLVSAEFIVARANPRLPSGPSGNSSPVRSRASFERGFSIVELLIVMGIIITLAGLAIPSLRSAIEAARVAKAIADIHTMEGDIVSYQVSNSGNLPHSLADIGRSDLLDSWGTPYQYLNIADDPLRSTVRLDRFLHPFNSDYDLYSKGKDKLSLPAVNALVSADDVIRANNGAYVGLASQF